MMPVRLLNENKVWRRCVGKFLMYVFLTFFAAGCATTSGPKSHAREVNSLKDLCRQHNIQWRWDSVSHVVTLEKNGKKAKVLVGSPNVYLGDKRVALNEPVDFKRSIIVVPGDFKEKVIGFLFDAPSTVPAKPSALTISKVKRIIVDAGHGGKDPGAIGPSGLYEKNVVLDIVMRLKSILERYGFDVVMTRDTDEFLSLQERTELASLKNGDLFISIHANAHGSSSVSGLEVYTAKDLDFTERAEQQRKINESTMYQQLKMERNSADLREIVSDLMYVNKEFESNRLAGIVAAETSEAIGTRNLGVKESRFFVVRNTLVPAILVEVGFLTNPKEERNLNTGLYRQRIASAMAKGILKYSYE